MMLMWPLRPLGTFVVGQAQSGRTMNAVSSLIADYIAGNLDSVVAAGVLAGVLLFLIMSGFVGRVVLRIEDLRS